MDIPIVMKMMEYSGEVRGSNRATPFLAKRFAMDNLAQFGAGVTHPPVKERIRALRGIQV
jgi:Zn-dependent protease with chaperone function